MLIVHDFICCECDAGKWECDSDAGFGVVDADDGISHSDWRRTDGGGYRSRDRSCGERDGEGGRGYVSRRRRFGRLLWACLEERSWGFGFGRSGVGRGVAVMG